MKICVTSDLHGNLPTIEECEMLLICGDILPLKIQMNHRKSKKWLLNEFKEWIKSQPVEQTVFIAGNHDFYCESHEEDMKNLFNSEIKYLCNSHYDYISDEGKVYRIFGTPYCKQFGLWAFMRDDDTLESYYRVMPGNCDIVISHDAPRLNELGCIRAEGSRWYGTDAGNEVLAKAILSAKPKYAFCGHIHSGQHEVQNIQGVNMANVSLVDETYTANYKPLYLNI